jgi:phosphoacetylglucosamine mutase
LKDCINQTIGDAISDILAIEVVLLNKNLTLEQWNQMYTDLPNRQLKVCVKDRSLIETYDAERRLLKPAQLQVEIDRLIGESPAKSRSFVRPSGTEDVVRIYAESITQEETDLLANKVAKVTYELAGGVGPKP